MATIEIFTDGSCHTQRRMGAWAAIVFVDNEKTVLSGYENDTTHNRMELVAVIKALEFIKEKKLINFPVKVVSDSQYVVGLKERKQKFLLQNYRANSGKEIQNCDLVKKLLAFEEEMKINFEKIKAHQKKSTVTNYNIEADKLSRKIVRDLVKLA